MKNKFRAEGRIVVSSGTVCRVKKSKNSARRAARHLNKLHKAKMRGWFEPPEYSL